MVHEGMSVFLPASLRVCLSVCCSSYAWKTHYIAEKSMAQEGMCLPAYSVCLSVCLSACLSLLFCLPACLSVCLSLFIVLLFVICLEKNIIAAKVYCGLWSKFRKEDLCPSVCLSILIVLLSLKCRNKV